MSRTHETPRSLHVTLWAIQALLAALFLFAGGMKLVLPVAALTQQAPLPGLFLRFIGLCEVAGALGLVLPGLLGIRTELTPLAARGLVIIMAGAVGVTLAAGQVAPALVPGIVGCLAVAVAVGRAQLAPQRPAQRVVLATSR